MGILVDAPNRALSGGSYGTPSAGGVDAPIGARGVPVGFEASSSSKRLGLTATGVVLLPAHCVLTPTGLAPVDHAFAFGLVSWIIS